MLWTSILFDEFPDKPLKDLVQHLPRRQGIQPTRWVEHQLLGYFDLQALLEEELQRALADRLQTPLDMTGPLGPVGSKSRPACSTRPS